MIFYDFMPSGTPAHDHSICVKKRNAMAIISTVFDGGFAVWRIVMIMLIYVKILTPAVTKQNLTSISYIL